MGKEFELIDIIDFDCEKVLLRKSLCAFLLRCLYQSINYALALTHFIPTSPPASLLLSSATPPSQALTWHSSHNPQRSFQQMWKLH